MTLPRRRRGDDRGSLSLVEIPLGTVLVVATALVVLVVATWFERAAAARAAADQAARTVVNADTWDQGAADAQAAVDEVAANYDLGPDDLTLQLDGSLERGAEVTATVTVDVPAIGLPLVGGIGSFSKSVSHTETVDQWRSLP
jgi:hypothetical protein